jgi:hypothetical protein
MSDGSDINSTIEEETEFFEGISLLPASTSESKRRPRTFWKAFFARVANTGRWVRIEDLFNGPNARDSFGSTAAYYGYATHTDTSGELIRFWSKELFR